MIERLFSLYDEELAFIREEVREFSGRFTKVASRLKLAEESEDPHVSRLIDSFALLTARLRLKIEDEFPEICQSLLQALYPQYLAPVPSCAIVQLELDHIGAELAEGVKIPKGSEMENDDIDGLTCIFRTCSDVQLFPFQIEKSSYTVAPFDLPIPPALGNRAQAAIVVEIKALSPQLDWKKTKVERLRLFLGGGRLGKRLYESLCRDLVGIGCYSASEPKGQLVAANHAQPVGFDTESSLLEPDPRTQNSFRLLWEFFALPEKFQFIDIDLMDVWSKIAGENLRICFFLEKPSSVLKSSMSKDSIRLGCTPVINLFEKSAEPISLTETQHEYRVIPSHRNPRGIEVHSVLRVIATKSGGFEEREFRPFHRPSHNLSSSGDNRYWHSARRRRLDATESTENISDVYLSIVDLQSRPHPEDQWTLSVKTLCCNGNFVTKLGQLSKLEFSGGPATATFVTPPSPTRRPIERDDWLWRLVSHLALNHLTIASDSDGQLLREMLSLYNVQEQAEVTNAIEGVSTVSYKRSTARLDNTGKGAGFCRGIDIEVVIEEEKFESLGSYLFSAILDHFFSSITSINSFTRLSVRFPTDMGYHYRGPARAGNKVLL